jgi:hypothetical protein
MVERGTPSSADSSRADWRGDCTMKAAKVAHVTLRDIGRLLRGKSFTFPYETRRFSRDKIVAMHGDGFQNRCWNGVINLDIVWSVLSFYTSKHSLPNALLISAILSFAQHTPNNEKMRPWVLACRDLSNVRCHTGLPSHLKSCQVIKCRHNEIHKYVSCTLTYRTPVE